MNLRDDPKESLAVAFQAGHNRQTAMKNYALHKNYPIKLQPALLRR